MPIETLLRIPFAVIGQCSPAPTSHWLQGKCARINLSLTGGFWYDFTKSQAASCELFSVNRRIWDL
jgi:hypothetical protein